MYAQSFSQMHPACSKFGCTVEQLKRKKNENNRRNKVKFAKAQTQIRKKVSFQTTETQMRWLILTRLLWVRMLFTLLSLKSQKYIELWQFCYLCRRKFCCLHLFVFRAEEKYEIKLLCWLKENYAEYCHKTSTRRAAVEILPYPNQWKAWISHRHSIDISIYFLVA